MKRLIPAVAAVIALSLAVFFQWKAQEVNGQAKGYRDQVTLLLQEPRDYQQAAQELEAWQEEAELAIWGEDPRQVFTGADGYSAQVSVITFLGNTELMFPCGVVLYDTDREGCLLDEKAAEELFGSNQVEGEYISGGSGSWAIRGVLPLQEGLVILPAGADNGEVLLDRLTVRLGDRERQSAAELLEQGGFRGSLLRMDFYDSLSWIRELVPGKWADFEGWRSNLEKKRQEWELVSNTKKYIPQLIQYRLYRCYHWYHGASIVLLLIFLILLIHLTIRPIYGKI